MNRTAVLGAGRVAGAVGLSLRHSPSTWGRIVGYDADASALSRMIAAGAVDEAAPDVGSAAGGASLVVASVPLSALPNTLADLSRLRDPPKLVVDTGPLAVPALAFAQAHLTETTGFISGHPVLGDSTERMWCFVPGPNLDAPRLETARNLAKALEARPVFMSAEEHDAYVAGTLQLPQLFGAVLDARLAREELAPLAHDVREVLGRLAAPDPGYAAELIVANRTYVEGWIGNLLDDLERSRGLLETGDSDALERLLRATSSDAHDEEPDPMPSLGTTLADFFLGRTLAEKFDRVSGRVRPTARRNVSGPESRR